MKTYVVYVDGVASELIQAKSHNAAEIKAKAKHAKKHVMVAYTEI
jgi:hypothetical protein